MANTRAIKSRIKSAKNISQITKAMEMVSAAKMKKAQDRVAAAAPYAQKLREVLQTLSTYMVNGSHPLLADRMNPKRALVIVYTSDKGLAGALNSNVFRQVGTLERELIAKGMEVEYVAIGKKARDFLRYTRRSIFAVFDGFGNTPHFSQIAPIVRLVIDEFTNEKYDVIHVVYSHFVSTLVQKAETLQLLPVNLPEGMENPRESSHNGMHAIPVFEPSPEVILDWLLPYYVEQQMYQFFLQAQASEHSARMIAMKNATDNAKEVQKELTLEYNSQRQAQITQQIAEIASATMV